MANSQIKPPEFSKKSFFAQKKSLPVGFTVSQLRCAEEYAHQQFRQQQIDHQQAQLRAQVAGSDPERFGLPPFRKKFLNGS